MASIVFTAPRHLEPNVVMTWAPGVLFIANRFNHLGKGEYVYVCNRNRILYRARYQETVFLDTKDTIDGEHRGPGWALRVGEPELPPREIVRRCSHPTYLDEELW